MSSFGEVDPETTFFARSEANWLVKSAIEKFLLLRNGIFCTADISKDEGA